MAKAKYASYFLCLLSLIFVLIPNSSEASRFNGVYLLELCEMDDKGEEKVEGGHMACQSYVSGVIDYHNVLRSLNVAPNVNICVPEAVTLYDLQKVVLYFLRNRPEHDAFVAAPAIVMALYEVYPCK